jgi:hypothetical protein
MEAKIEFDSHFFRQGVLDTTLHQIISTGIWVKHCSVVVWFMVFNATFNNISVISWQSVLLLEETGVPGENHWSVASHWQTLSHNVVSSTPCLKKWESNSIFASMKLTEILLKVALNTINQTTTEQCFTQIPVEIIWWSLRH